MNRKTTIAGGIILILLGGLFLVSEIFPQVFNFWDWPFIIIGAGVVFLLWAILSSTGGLAVPGAILSGIGGILFYQNMTGDWDSWSYIWGLIPGFVGTGILLSGIIDRNLKKTYTPGLILILISAVMFFAFGSHFGLQHSIAMFWPVLLIGLGIFSLVKALAAGKKRQE